MSFHEPVLDVWLSDDSASLRYFFDAGSSESRKLVVLPQAYASLSSQEAIADICLSLIREAGLQLIAVEGGDGPVVWDSSLRDVGQAMRVSEISAGVISAAARSEHPVEVLGVDDMTAVRRSREHRTHAESGAKVRDRIYTEVCGVLRKCQDRCYPRVLRKLRRERLAMFGQPELDIVRSVGLLFELAAETRVSLVGFPRVCRLKRVIAGDRAMRDRAVERERDEFMRRVTGAAFGWFRYTGDDRVNIDWDKAAKPIDFWAMNMGYTPEELRRVAEAAGIESLIDSCITWYRWWLEERVAGTNSRQSYSLLEDWMRFALYAEIPCFEFRALRKYIAHWRDSEGLADPGLLEEVNEATRTLADGCGKQARRLFEAENGLNELYTALRLSRLRHLVDPDGLSIEAMREALSRIEGVTELPRAMLEPRYFAELENPLAGARGYYRDSAERSMSMAKRTVETLANRRQQRGLLVVGGFHERGVRWTLEELQGLTWSVVQPKVDLERDGMKERHSRI